MSSGVDCAKGAETVAQRSQNAHVILSRRFAYAPHQLVGACPNVKFLARSGGKDLNSIAWTEPQMRNCWFRECQNQDSQN